MLKKKKMHTEVIKPTEMKKPKSFKVLHFCVKVRMTVLSYDPKVYDISYYMA